MLNRAAEHRNSCTPGIAGQAIQTSTKRNSPGGVPHKTKPVPIPSAKPFQASVGIEGYRRLVPSRVAVVGCSGSGKTTVVRRVVDRLGLEHVELDALAHQPG